LSGEGKVKCDELRLIGESQMKFGGKIECCGEGSDGGGSRLNIEGTVVLSGEVETKELNLMNAELTLTDQFRATSKVCTLNNSKIYMGNTANFGEETCQIVAMGNVDIEAVSDEGILLTQKIFLQNGTKLKVGVEEKLSINGEISGEAEVIKVGKGELEILKNNNGFKGEYDIQEGTLSVAESLGEKISLTVATKAIFKKDVFLDKLSGTGILETNANVIFHVEKDMEIETKMEGVEILEFLDSQKPVIVTISSKNNVKKMIVGTNVTVKIAEFASVGSPELLVKGVLEIEKDCVFSGMRVTKDGLVKSEKEITLIGTFADTGDGVIDDGAAQDVESEISGDVEIKHLISNATTRLLNKIQTETFKAAVGATIYSQDAVSKVEKIQIEDGAKFEGFGSIKYLELNGVLQAMKEEEERNECALLKIEKTVFGEKAEFITKLGEKTNGKLDIKVADYIENLKIHVQTDVPAEDLVQKYVLIELPTNHELSGLPTLEADIGTLSPSLFHDQDRGIVLNIENDDF
jgi:hypothetical protein